MNDRQKDWIIFLGVIPDMHDEAVAVVRYWRECYGVPGSGFFGRTDPLPVVPKGLLKIPERI